MQRAKLLKLADFLENYVKDDWFNLGMWAEDGWQEKECGTKACAIGWFTACCPRSNLKLRETFYSIYLEPVLIKNGKIINKQWRAIALTFDITPREAEYLFSPDYYEDNEYSLKSEVIKRIRDFVAGVEIVRELKFR